MGFTGKYLAAAIGASFLCTSLALAQDLPTASPEALGMSSSKLDGVAHTLQAEVDRGNIPGAVIMVNRRGKLIYSRAIGYQNRDADVPMKVDSIFRIYSMTKPITAVAAMMLAEEGKLELADTVGSYLPEFESMQVCNPGKDAGGRPACILTPAERPITIQDLLRHTSGIGYGETTKNAALREAYGRANLFADGGIDYDRARQIPPQDEITGLARSPLATQPGSNWEYGMSMDLMGRVIDVVSGQSLGQFLDKRIFEPLHMKDTGFYIPADKQSRLAEALAVDPYTKKRNQLFDVTKPPANEGGGVGLVSTAADYMNFASMLLNGGVLDGKRILSPMTIALMTSDQLGNRTTLPLPPGQLLMGTDGYTFGLGFMVRQGAGLASVPGSPGEYMWAGAAGTFFWIDPKEQLAVVVMSQVPGPSRPHYRRLIKQMVSAAVLN